jgi:hypothetical protein
MYNIGNIFTAAGIVPGNGYTGNEVMAKLKEALGKQPGK